jgi:hypothetical protein
MGLVKSAKVEYAKSTLDAPAPVNCNHYNKS